MQTLHHNLGEGGEGHTGPGPVAEPESRGVGCSASHESLSKTTPRNGRGREIPRAGWKKTWNVRPLVTYSCCREAERAQPGLVWRGPPGGPAQFLPTSYAPEFGPGGATGGEDQGPDDEEDEGVEELEEGMEGLEADYGEGGDLSMVD